MEILFVNLLYALCILVLLQYLCKFAVSLFNSPSMTIKTEKDTTGKEN